MVLRRVADGEDEFGNPTFTNEEVDTRCSLQQRRSTENDDGGQLSDAFWLLCLPIGTEIDTGDAVRVKGRKYEVKGEPWEAEEGNPDMWHIEANVERTAGTGED